VCLKRYIRYKGHLRQKHEIEDEATIAKLESLARAEDAVGGLLRELKAFREEIEPRIEEAIGQLVASGEALPLQYPSKPPTGTKVLTRGGSELTIGAVGKFFQLEQLFQETGGRATWKDARGKGIEVRVPIFGAARRRWRQLHLEGETP